MIEVKQVEAEITEDKLKIRQLETNLKNYNSWDYKHYPLTKEEADVVLELIAGYEEIGGGEDGR